MSETENVLRSNLAWELGEALATYNVRLHYQASATAGHRLYAVFERRLAGPSEQVSEPTTHAAAARDRDQLIVARLLEIVDRYTRPKAVPA